MKCKSCSSTLNINKIENSWECPKCKKFGYLDELVKTKAERDRIQADRFMELVAPDVKRRRPEVTINDTVTVAPIEGEKTRRGTHAPSHEELVEFTRHVMEREADRIMRRSEGYIEEDIRLMSERLELESSIWNTDSSFSDLQTNDSIVDKITDVLGMDLSVTSHLTIELKNINPASVTIEFDSSYLDEFRIRLARNSIPFHTDPYFADVSEIASAADIVPPRRVRLILG